jgi:hypothetical protein
MATPQPAGTPPAGRAPARDYPQPIPVVFPRLPTYTCAWHGRRGTRVPHPSHQAEVVMSKGMDKKKNVKKQPTKTLKEKREAKKAKKS